uniref:Uncharacterized protein n=1 Tax=Rhizophora mucronata TaxID=61149 RepID=A0A2P2QHS3_RHIMU
MDKDSTIKTNTSSVTFVLT